MPTVNSSVLVALGLGAFVLGYRFYSKFIAERIYRLDRDFPTPAHTMRDDIDFIPTHPFVLWGHHFTAVAGRRAHHWAGYRGDLGLATGVPVGRPRNHLHVGRS